MFWLYLIMAISIMVLSLSLSFKLSVDARVTLESLKSTKRDADLNKMAEHYLEETQKSSSDLDDTDPFYDEFLNQPHIRQYDERIKRMKEELDSQVSNGVGEGYEAEILHPLVYNVKHEEVDKELQIKVIKDEASE